MSGVWAASSILRYITGWPYSHSVPYIPLANTKCQPCANDVELYFVGGLFCIVNVKLGSCPLCPTHQSLHARSVGQRIVPYDYTCTSSPATPSSTHVSYLNYCSSQSHYTSFRALPVIGYSGGRVTTYGGSRNSLQLE